MRRRSEATGQQATASTTASAPAKKADGADGIEYAICPKKECGLKQSASMVLKAGKCVRCDTPMTAPAGTKETFTGTIAAEQAAKHGKPLGTAPTPAAAPPPVPPPAKTAPAAKADDFGAVEETEAVEEDEPISSPDDDFGSDEDVAFTSADPDPIGDAARAMLRGTDIPSKAQAVHEPDPFGGEDDLPTPPPLPTPDRPDSLMGIHEREQRADEVDAADEGDEVVAIWAEEVVQVEAFCTFRVGPFESRTKVRLGEDRAMALHRIYVELCSYAEKERERKCRSFIHALRGVRATVKAGG